MKKFPQLCLITPKNRSQGDTFYVNNILVSSLVEEKTVLHEKIQTTTPSETDSSENDTNLPSQQQASQAHSDLNPLICT